MSDWLLALHSSTETLGIALVAAEAPIGEARVICRSLGRALTNELVISLQQLLPADQKACRGHRTGRIHRYPSHCCFGQDAGSAVGDTTARCQQFRLNGSKASSTAAGAAARPAVFNRADPSP